MKRGQLATFARPFLSLSVLFLFLIGWRRKSSDLVEESKSVWHTPMFHKFAVCKSTDVHYINGHGLPSAGLDRFRLLRAQTLSLVSNHIFDLEL